ncbi:hypothetical protein VFPPC_18305 [Pochonia chlamydosporia 170]|uniref:Uncharacterized protein n=1 Tax=Pochonia chlamydosporia 170 TaxID=1380566 RepID=A0A219AP21_METCM|nr:hypothetical protein VFPPC_18305 [Pochonia chlamydosporia 170]OWT42566.1 hypothetical protein VFPPC_18305 [Pochonia chlamydosporia 170]
MLGGQTLLLWRPPSLSSITPSCPGLRTLMRGFPFFQCGMYLKAATLNCIRFQPPTPDLHMSSFGSSRVEPNKTIAPKATELKEFHNPPLPVTAPGDTLNKLGHDGNLCRHWTIFTIE